MAKRTTSNTAPKKKPIAEATRRRNIQGALWQHSKEGNNYYVAGLTRSEKDKEGNWSNETIYVPLDDIPKAIAILQELETEAYEIIEETYRKSQDAA